MALTLKINDIEVTVPKGSTILEVAEQAGVYIPTLCHDKRIAPAGACRLCIVEDRKKPGQLIPSCFTPARDNMDIITESPAIRDAIKEQLKLILINHPLDCPVCDKAGECELQDLVIRYGLTGAPYQLKQPFRPIERESPLIERDMTRCILCGRCVRICGELQGKNELEFLNRGYKTYIGTDGGRKLDCDFCGLCVSTCPVGALTDKLFKNTTRVWKLEKRRTVCSHCGLGCSIELNMENNSIRRVTAPVHKDGKEGLLCVRGRFGWLAFADPRRLAGPQLRDGKGRRDVEWGEALSYTARRISEVCKNHGGESLAAVTADLLTTEEASAYGRFFRSVIGSDAVASVQAAGYRRIMAQLDNLLPAPWKMASPNDLMAADILLVLGGGAAELHPVLKPMINRYLKGEGKELIVISSWPDYYFERATLPMAVAPGLLDDFLSDLRAAFDVEGKHSHTDASRYGIDTGKLARLISLLQGEAEITILVVPDLYGHHDARASLAASLHDRVRGILPLGGQFNSLGAVAAGGFASATGRDFNDILGDIEAGRIRALYLLGEDPLEGCPNPARVREALAMLDLLICQSPYETSVTELAHVVLPTALPPEKEGSVLSVTGERHAIRRVMSKPAGVRSDGEILREIARIMGREEEVFPKPGASRSEDTDRLLKNAHAGHSGLDPESGKLSNTLDYCLHMDGDTETERVSFKPDLSPEKIHPPALEASVKTGTGINKIVQQEKALSGTPSAEFPFQLLPVPSLFGDSILIRHCPEIDALRNGLTVIMGNDDFAAQGLAEKEAVTVSTPFGAARAIVRSSARIKKGTLLLLHSAGSPDGLSLLRPGYAAVPAAIGKGENK
jgi:NADH dehydrogenase/NADH:ubiquinone oxidoreductase subunit G